MNAIVQSGFGPPSEALALAEVARPAIGPTHVLVRVHAVGIAKGTWLATRGLPVDHGVSAHPWGDAAPPWCGGASWD
jgi:NADPH:quinone reductase-like Zn-dependent oxidoreductase